jgi:uncharacterized membrane protein YbhN (UPF0104 family)
VTINNVLGLLGHILLLVLCLVIFSNDISQGNDHSARKDILVVILSLVVTLLIAVVASVNKRVRGLFKDVIKQLGYYKSNPSKVHAALFSQMSLTLFNVLCLEYSGAAIGIHLSFITYFIIFTIGAGARNVTPTPGGLGGFEAGLVAGFIVYNVKSADALAAALLFRLVSFWLPLFIGFVCFIYAQKRSLFSTSAA